MGDTRLPFHAKVIFPQSAHYRALESPPLRLYAGVPADD